MKNNIKDRCSNTNFAWPARVLRGERKERRKKKALQITNHLTNVVTGLPATQWKMVLSWQEEPLEGLEHLSHADACVAHAKLFLIIFYIYINIKSLLNYVDYNLIKLNWKFKKAIYCILKMWKDKIIPY